MALTQEQLSNIHLMQKIFVLPASYKWGIDCPLETTKVSKVGTKFFYTADGRKWELATGRNVTEHRNAELFISESAYNEHREMKELWQTFYRSLTAHIPPKNLTLAELKQIIAIIEKK